jgi:hypothetical protein
MAKVSWAAAPANGAGPPPTTAASKEASAEAAALNQDFYNYIFIVVSSLTAALLIWRVSIELIKHIRTLACLDNETQRYFVKPSPTWASIKKSFIYAPVFGRRHNREFQLSAAVNVGTLPTRLQLFFLMAYLGTNVAFCVLSIPWDKPLATVAGDLRNRTGILSVVNMVSVTLSFQDTSFTGYFAWMDR